MDPDLLRRLAELLGFPVDTQGTQEDPVELEAQRARPFPGEPLPEDVARVLEEPFLRDTVPGILGFDVPEVRVFDPPTEDPRGIFGFVDWSEPDVIGVPDEVVEGVRTGRARWGSFSWHMSPEKLANTIAHEAVHAGDLTGREGMDVVFRGVPIAFRSVVEDETPGPTLSEERLDEMDDRITSNSELRARAFENAIQLMREVGEPSLEAWYDRVRRLDTKFPGTIQVIENIRKLPIFRDHPMSARFFPEPLETRIFNPRSTPLPPQRGN